MVEGRKDWKKNYIRDKYRDEYVGRYTFIHRQRYIRDRQTGIRTERHREIDTRIEI
jgi:hypothetical protein